MNIIRCNARQLEVKPLSMPRPADSRSAADIRTRPVKPQYRSAPRNSVAESGPQNRLGWSKKFRPDYRCRHLCPRQPDLHGRGKKSNGTFITRRRIVCNVEKPSQNCAAFEGRSPRNNHESEQALWEKGDSRALAESIDARER